jgi:hypothetical protein
MLDAICFWNEPDHRRWPAREQAYRGLVFELAMSIAGELVTCFGGLLTGSNKQFMEECTPEKRLPTGGRRGHTTYGVQWQLAVLGGLVVVRKDPNSGLGVRQGGIARLMDTYRREWLIPEDDIRGMVKRGKILGVPKLAGAAFADTA